MIRRCFQKWFRPATRIGSGTSMSMTSSAPENNASLGALPPSPKDILAHREAHEEIVFAQTRVRTDEKNDTPIAAIYRIYEHVILDQNIILRNELEGFWFHSSWAIQDIPDPQDPDPERYAVLACITALLVLSFNERIMKLGLPRNAPSILTHEMIEEFKTRVKVPEEAPQWAATVPALENTLEIPHWDRDKHDFVPLEGFSSYGASPDFQSKNILVWEPHIYFT